MEVRCLSVKQPWASLLVSGVKRFEVRSWAPSRLGKLFVHASGSKAVGLPMLRRDRLYHHALQEAGLEDESAWPISAIVGMVTVSRVWGPDGRLPRLSKLDRYLCGTIDGMCLWEIGSSTVFPKPIPCPGKLNLWTPTPSVARKLGAATGKLPGA